MVKIIKRLNHSNNNHYGLGNQKRTITVHITGNYKKGANAEMHARYIENGSKETWHYTVDDQQAIQHFSHNTQCWHAGDGRGSGNLHSIAIEICVNSDGDYKKAISNAIKLIQKLMKELSIPITHVVQHNHWSGKDCPKDIRNGRDGISWKVFIDRIKGTKQVVNKKTLNEDRVYKEDGVFYPNTTILVSDRPDVRNRKVIARYYRGENVRYHTVHIKNGYVWLQYNRFNGGQGYIPCRTFKNGKFGNLWGTIK